MLIMVEDQGAQMGALGTKSLKLPKYGYDRRKGHILQKSFRDLFSLFAVQSSDVHRALSARERLPGPVFQPSAWSDADYYTGFSMRLHVVPVDKIPCDEFVTGSKIEFGSLLHHDNTDSEAISHFIRHTQ